MAWTFSFHCANLKMYFCFEVIRIERHFVWGALTETTSNQNIYPFFSPLSYVVSFIHVGRIILGQNDEETPTNTYLKHFVYRKLGRREDIFFFVYAFNCEYCVVNYVYFSNISYCQNQSKQYMFIV